MESSSLSLLLVSLEERLLAPTAGFETGPAGAEGLRNPDGCRGAKPVLDLHGVSRDGASVLLHVHGFRPFFYAKPPCEVCLEQCLRALDRAVRSDDGGVAAGQKAWHNFTAPRSCWRRWSALR